MISQCLLEKQVANKNNFFQLINFRFLKKYFYFKSSGIELNMLFVFEELEIANHHYQVGSAKFVEFFIINVLLTSSLT